MILVGEIRGEEAYVLFQALATGHGGLCTMHADDVDTVVKRLTQPPMNIPQTILSLMNCIIVVKQVNNSGFNPNERKGSGRKFVKVAEVEGSGLSKEVFTWNPSSDTFQSSIEDSYLFNQIAKSVDAPLSVVTQEFERRKRILVSMVEQNMRDFSSVHKALNSSLNLEALEAEQSEVQ
jgi:flagellar protein FlaI